MDSVITVTTDNSAKSGGDVVVDREGYVEWRILLRLLKIMFCKKNINNVKQMLFSLVFGMDIDNFLTKQPI